MSQVTRKIVWEKWRDPFGSDVKDMDWPGAIGNFKTDEIKEDHKKQKLVMTGYAEEDDEWNEDQYETPKSPLPTFGNGAPTKIMVTPVGLVPITEHTRAGDIFNFWVAHTTFRMTKNIMDIIDNTDGIESLDVYTPYRWRISIGKAFDSAEVKQRLTNNLNASPPQNNVH